MYKLTHGLSLVLAHQREWGVYIDLVGLAGVLPNIIAFRVSFSSLGDRRINR
jgi:hypothetical protein